MSAKRQAMIEFAGSHDLRWNPGKRFARYRRALACVALVWLSSGTAVFGQSRYIGWHSDLKTAAEQAARGGKPLMVVFRCVR